LDKLLYKLVYYYVKIGLHLFYKQIKVTGIKNIPKKEAILFVANHQNAMMDPILIATHNTRILYFLARASAFKNTIASKLLNAIHAIAIYRVRDGVNSKELNKQVFKKCVEILSQNKSLLIFPEGSHSRKRQIRSLRSGFSQISHDFLTKYPNHQLYIVPVGLNFTDTINYPEKVTIYYGKKINVNQYFKKDYRKFTGELINVVTESLKKITVHIPNENYDRIITQISPDEFLNPSKTNQKILENSFLNEKKLSKRKKRKRNIFYYLMLFNTLCAFLFWYWLRPKIKEKEFISTAKFSIGLTLFPLIYLVKATIIYAIFDIRASVLYLLFSVLIVFLSTKTN